MDKFKFIMIVAFIGILTLSCSSKKNILYMQDLDDDNSYFFDYVEYKIKVDDILKINISAQTTESLAYGQNPFIQPSENKESLLYSGFQVDLNGYISLPSIGQIKVEGRSISELEDFLYNEIKNKGILLNPNIDVKLLNSHFTILGEVNRPGKYDFLQNNMNILEAIGMAGDLTINGKRQNIKLIREINGNKTISSFDLTTTKFLNSDDFQIFPGDIIIVDPNNTRIKNAGIIGNSGTLLSLLSFVLSSIIIINN